MLLSRVAISIINFCKWYCYFIIKLFFLLFYRNLPFLFLLKVFHKQSLRWTPVNGVIAIRFLDLCFATFLAVSSSAEFYTISLLAFCQFCIKLPYSIPLLIVYREYLIVLFIAVWFILPFIFHSVYSFISFHTYTVHTFRHFIE